MAVRSVIAGRASRRWERGRIVWLVPLLLPVVLPPLLLASCRVTAREKPAPSGPAGGTGVGAAPVALEVAVVEVCPEHFGKLEDVWATYDAQALPIDARRSWDQNGIRCAVIGPQLSPATQELLEAPTPETKKKLAWQLGVIEQLGVADKGSLILHQNVYFHVEEHRWFPTSVPHDVLSWSYVADRQRRVGNASNARGGFQVGVQELRGKRATLRIVPQVHHGEVRPRIGTEDGEFLLQEQQQVVEMGELALRVELRQGETFVVAPSPPLGELGGKLLVAGDSDAPRQRLLMIRLVHVRSQAGDR